MGSFLSPLPSTSLVCGPDIDHELQVVLAGCVRTLYEAIAAPNAATACVFTSTVLADALNRVGIAARAVSAAVEGELPEGRFGIGHPAYPLARPGAWKGHACCMIRDVLVDPTISNVRRMGIEAPLMVAVRTGRDWHPAATLTLAPGIRLSWQPSQAKLSAHPDLRSPLRGPATARAAAALAQHLARHAIAPVASRAAGGAADRTRHTTELSRAVRRLRNVPYTGITEYPPGAARNIVQTSNADDFGETKVARVLVIDDEEMMRRLLVRVLTHLGHDVETACDGEEGLHKFHDGEYDTVLTDLLMPTRDGMGTIHELRRAAPGLRIVAMSGSFHPLSDEVRLAKAVGANCVLEKPFGMKDVASALAA